MLCAWLIAAALLHCLTQQMEMPHTGRNWQLSLSRPRPGITRILHSFLMSHRSSRYVGSGLTISIWKTCATTVPAPLLEFFLSISALCDHVRNFLSECFCHLFCCSHVILGASIVSCWPDVLLFEVYVRHVCGAFRELCLPLSVCFSQNFLFVMLCVSISLRRFVGRFHCR